MLPQMGSLCWLCLSLLFWLCWLSFGVHFFFIFSVSGWVGMNVDNESQDYWGIAMDSNGEFTNTKFLYKFNY